ncbi:MAG: ABC transporter permease [Planctomycetes bacterium]|nr:ABC transporter permease [Planctomycetota bacterium]
MGSVERRALRRLGRMPSAWAGGLLVGCFLAVAAAAPALAPHDPVRGDERERLTPPGVGGHPLGTDALGNDVYSRVLHGARTSLAIGLASVALAAAVGIPLGAVAGYAGGRLDALLMRGVDVLLAFPGILLAISIMSVLGRSLGWLCLAVGVVGIPAFARQVRAGVLAERALDYVQAARALGARWPRLVFATILPNCLGPIIVLATLGLGSAVLEAAGLGFVGLGPEVGTPEWGSDISLNRNLFQAAPWAVVAPGVAIAAAVLGFNLLGDALRDVLDPRSS